MKIATKLKEYICSAKVTEFKVLDSLGLTSSNSLRVTLNRLVKSKQIYNPIKGYYVCTNADLFEVATILRTGYLTLQTALYLHHLSEEYPFTIYVASNFRKTIKIGEHEICYFRPKNYFGVEHTKYKMASVCKTIYDCLLFADKVGYAKIAKAIYNSKFLAKDFLYLCKNENSAFYQRLGYILSILPKLDEQKKIILQMCEKKVLANVYLQGRKKGEYDSKWKVIDNVGKKVILSWWDQ